MAQTLLTDDNTTCAVCKCQGSDVRLTGCGCTLHARCTPLSLILEREESSSSFSGEEPCPICNSGKLSGFYLFPLSFGDLDKAIELRKAAALGDSHTKPETIASGQGTKRIREDDEADGDEDIAVEAAYVVFTQGKESLATLVDAESHRTGRWTDEEVAFVDQLVTAFEKGTLPLPRGTKLGTFLGDILLCRSSRLTKKMKNAKLSTRSFELPQKEPRTSVSLDREDREMLSVLQEQFIKSVATPYSEVELRFNILKQWRTYFSDLCVQIGYPNLDVHDWIASLEEYERLSSNAEERMRNVRRRRLGFSFSAGSSIPRARMDSISSNTAAISKVSTIKTDELAPGGGKESTAAKEVAVTSNAPPRVISDHSFPGIPRTFDTDFENTFMSLLGKADAQIQDHDDSDLNSLGWVGDDHPRAPRNVDPFLEAIASFMEDFNLPFQHADVWVPSFVAGKSQEEDVRLLNAGFVTRRDQDGELWSDFEGFGEYSKNFSFVPGQGLPGRVYVSGRSAWEFEVNEIDPYRFHRAGGAKEYGVKTATAIPFDTKGVGRIVVVLYSRNHIQEDARISNQCALELSKYSPKPKWKLVIEIGSGQQLASTAESSCAQRANKRARTDSYASSSHGNGDRNRNSPFLESDDDLVPQMAPFHVTPVPDDDGEDEVVQNIISLLGEQLAIQNGLSPAGHALSSSLGSTSSNLLPHFMSIRLMMLRPAHRRSPEENEIVYILTNSYKAYAAGSKRNGGELAVLLAHEWLCLRSNLLPGPTMNQAVEVPKLPAPKQEYTRYEMLPVPSLAVQSFGSSAMAAPCLKIGASHNGQFQATATIHHNHSLSGGNNAQPKQIVTSASFGQSVCVAKNPTASNDGIYRSQSLSRLLPPVRSVSNSSRSHMNRSESLS